MSLRNTKLLIFGSPVAGTPVMEVTPLAALDLPLKVLVWADDAGTVWMTYLSRTWLTDRHGIPADLAKPLSAPDAACEPRRLTKLPESRTEHEPDVRFTYANERTFLAWNRTALVLIATGVAATQLLPKLQVQWGRRLLGLPLIALGAVVAADSFRHWRANERAMRRGDPLSPLDDAPRARYRYRRDRRPRRCAGRLREQVSIDGPPAGAEGQRPFTRAHRAGVEPFGARGPGVHRRPAPASLASAGCGRRRRSRTDRRLGDRLGRRPSGLHRLGRRSGRGGAVGPNVFRLMTVGTVMLAVVGVLLTFLTAS